MSTQDEIQTERLLLELLKLQCLMMEAESKARNEQSDLDRWHAEQLDLSRRYAEAMRRLGKSANLSQDRPAGIYCK